MLQRSSILQHKAMRHHSSKAIQAVLTRWRHRLHGRLPMAAILSSRGAMGSGEATRHMHLMLQVQTAPWLTQ